MTKRAAISALGTRISFLVIAWLMLSRSARLVDVAIVAGSQLVAYILFRQVALRLRPMPATADLLSIAMLGAIAFTLSNVVLLASLAAGLGLLRAFGDRFPDAVTTAREDKPGRDGLVRVLLFITGAGVGAAALWLGPMGALWANAMVFAVAAAQGALSAATTKVSNVDTSKLLGLQTDPLVRRLALTLFATNLFAQAGAVLLAVLWARQVTQTPQLLGLVAAAFMLGLIGGGLAFAGLTRNGGASISIALGCLVGGGAAYLFPAAPPARSAARGGGRVDERCRDGLGQPADRHYALRARASGAALQSGRSTRECLLPGHPAGHGGGCLVPGAGHRNYRPRRRRGRVPGRHDDPGVRLPHLAPTPARRAQHLGQPG
jgi:hypothetical protein